jgi:hypothetical protein
VIKLVMPQARSFIALTSPRSWACASLFGSGVLWASAMAPKLLAQLEFGPLCSGHGLFAAHCPACYAAGGLLLAAVALAVAPGRIRLADRTSSAS